MKWQKKINFFNSNHECQKQHQTIIILKSKQRPNHIIENDHCMGGHFFQNRITCQQILESKLQFYQLISKPFIKNEKLLFIEIHRSKLTKKRLNNIICGHTTQTCIFDWKVCELGPRGAPSKVLAVMNNIYFFKLIQLVSSRS